ncbi:hypothetical protein LOK49_LG02G00822 [Camellia lanceoleosa]|uniref:Uncharacterized protein n=1 Tax=Camellia lanceoleosa TaxID=1840588 RepID=A0ACC0IS56_9ERIC|nr:hypothetical protein LOK49_LG02G00822 [Camellia lanceoleosa]
MGPDMELKRRSGIIMEASDNKENVGATKEPKDKHMRYANNYEDNAFEMKAVMDEQTEGTEISQEVEVNILEHTKSSEIALVEAEFQDATENSSSFGDTVSGVENSALLGDAEVVSELHGNASSAFPFNGYGEDFRMRRKRLTPHWRTFIRPLMWRCKWVELQIKNFESQALKYDGELAEFNRRKQFELDNCSLEGFGAKSFPFSCQSQSKEVMKRKKRKRIEDTMAIASYMSHHNLFSYFENKRSAAVVASIDDDRGKRVILAEKSINVNDEFGVNDELLSHEFRDGDNSLEQILWKLGIVQSQISKIKSRFHKVMLENVGKFIPLTS